MLADILNIIFLAWIPVWDRFLRFEVISIISFCLTLCKTITRTVNFVPFSDMPVFYTRNKEFFYFLFLNWMCLTIIDLYYIEQYVSIIQNLNYKIWQCYFFNMAVMFILIKRILLNDIIIKTIFYQGNVFIQIVILINVDLSVIVTRYAYKPDFF